MEIFCVILGWLLAQATTYINDVKKSKKRKSALLNRLKLIRGGKTTN